MKDCSSVNVLRAKLTPIVEEFTRLTDRAQQTERQIESFDFEGLEAGLENCLEAFSVCVGYVEAVPSLVAKDEMAQQQQQANGTGGFGSSSSSSSSSSPSSSSSKVSSATQRLAAQDASIAA